MCRHSSPLLHGSSFFGRHGCGHPPFRFLLRHIHRTPASPFRGAYQGQVEDRNSNRYGLHHAGHRGVGGWTRRRLDSRKQSQELTLGCHLDIRWRLRTGGSDHILHLTNHQRRHQADGESIAGYLHYYLHCRLAEVTRAQHKSIAMFDMYLIARTYE